MVLQIQPFEEELTTLPTQEDNIPKPLVQAYEPSESRKAKYGAAKETMVLGSAWRMFKAGTGLGTEGDTFAKRREDAYNQHMEEVYEAYPEFRSGAYDNDASVFAGQMGTVIADPILWIPWIGWGGKAYKAGQVSVKAGQAALAAGQKIKGATDITLGVGKSGLALAALGGGTAGADLGLRMLDQEGRIDPKQWATGTALGAAFSPAFAALGIGARAGINKVFPTLFSNKSIADDVIKTSLGEINKRNKTSNLSFEKLSEIAKNPVIQSAIKSIQDNTIEFRNYQQLTKILDQVGLNKQTLKELRKKLKETPLNKARSYKVFSERANIIKEIADIEELLNVKIKNSSISKITKLTNITLGKAEKEIKLEIADNYRKATQALTSANAEYIAAITEEIYKKGGAAALTDRIMRGILASTVYPTFGGVIGATYGIMSEADDDTASSALYGATIMGAYRLIGQRNIIPKQVNDGIFNKIINQKLNNSLWILKRYTSMTTSTAVESRGPVMKRFSNLLLHSFKGGTKSVEQKAGETKDAFKALIYAEGGILDERTYGNVLVQQVSNNIVRGAKKNSVFQVTEDSGKTFKSVSIKDLIKQDKLNNTTVVKDAMEVAKKTKSFLRVHKKYLEDAGFDIKEVLTDYFPRVYNLNYIAKNQDAFIDDVAKVLLNKNKGKGGIATYREEAQDIFNKLMKVDYDNVIKDVGLLSGTKGSKTIAGFKLPLSEHVELDRLIKGTFDEVEGPLSKYFINDISFVLNNMVSKSTKSVEFAKVFGVDGRGLSLILDDLSEQYVKQGFKPNVLSGYQKADLEAVKNSINALFGRHGDEAGNFARTVAGLTSFLTNTRLMGTVALANLGDIVQAFSNSYYFSTWMKGIAATPILPRRLPFSKVPLKQTDQPVDILYMQHDNVARQALNKLGASAFVQEADPGKILKAISRGNEYFFKAVGLEDVTLLGRRFAYNFGAIDGINLAKDVARLVAKEGKNLEDLIRSSTFAGRKARKLYTRLADSGMAKVDSTGKIINLDEIAKLATFKSWREAKLDEVGLRLMNQSGRASMDRDAIIPAVGNRLLFTQTRNPLLRLIGQFSSWAQAKTSQTNALLQRIEKGDAKLATGMLMALPIYSAIHQLRRYIKNGFEAEDTRPVDAFADGVILSGNPGWLASQLYSFKTYNPREPLNFFPGYEAISDTFSAAKDLGSGRPFREEGAFSDYMLEYMDKLNLWLLPPEIRDLIVKVNPDDLWWLNYSPLVDRDFDVKPGDFGLQFGDEVMTPFGFNIGGVVGKTLTEVGKKVAKKSADDVLLGDPAKTQITTTSNTYGKYASLIDEVGLNKKNYEAVNILDYGSGLGLGSKILGEVGDVKSFEPYVNASRINKLNGKLPDYTKTKDLIKKESKTKFNAIVSHAVLNVVEDVKVRSQIVKNIASLLDDEGIAIINTRPAISGATKKYKDGFLMGSDKNITFQKPFSQKELTKFVQETLGDSYNVIKVPDRYKISGSNVLIKRNLSNDVNV